METYTVTVDSHKTIRFYKPDTKILHRLDGPAVEYSDGGKEWWVGGNRHRTDGPAVEYSDGGKEWWVGGKRHRTDGPAIECSDGYKEWWVGGKRHRTDGPAVECSDGYKEWWVEDQILTEEEFKAATAPKVLDSHPDQLEWTTLFINAANVIRRAGFPVEHRTKFVEALEAMEAKLENLKQFSDTLSAQVAAKDAQILELRKELERLRLTVLQGLVKRNVPANDSPAERPLPPLKWEPPLTLQPMITLCKTETP